MNTLALLTLTALAPVTQQMAVTPRGFVDSAYAFQLGGDGALIYGRTRARLGLSAQGEDAALTVSVEAIHDAVVPSETRLRLYEGFAEYVGGGWDVRIGRQIIVWGKADGVRLVDLLNPSDLTHFIPYEFDDTRIPIDSLRLRLWLDAVDIELVGIPFFTPTKPPGADSPWYRSSLPADGSVTVAPAALPADEVASMEVAIRASVYLPGVDLAVSGLYLWDDEPVMDAEIGASGAVLTPRYHRVGVVGAELAAPVGDFVIRGEGAYYIGRRLRGAALGASYDKDTIGWLVGLDWFVGGGWTLSAQATGESVIAWTAGIDQREHGAFGTLSVSKTLLRDTLRVSSMLYVDVVDLGLFERFHLDYALADAFHIYLGLDVLVGDEGTFGQYADNTNAWLKAKYSF